MGFFERLNQATAAIRQKAPLFKPQIGLILGSGVGSLTDEMTETIRIPYRDIPGFPISTVLGHAGVLVLGKLNGVPIVCLSGRVHVYEGANPDHFKMMVRVIKHLGCDTLIMTSASGSLRPEVGPGELVIIKDHINLYHQNPLIGQNDEELGPRFYSMENAYDAETRESFKEVARQLDIPLHEGIYFSTLGPGFETPAEINLYRTWGVDVIGMSTIPEVYVARHCGLKVAVIAPISNFAAGMSSEELTHEGTLQGAHQAMEKLKKLLKAYLKKNAKQAFEEVVRSAVVQDDFKKVARRVLPLVDLTLLNGDDNEERVRHLCRLATTEHGYVAAVCIYPKFVRLAKSLLAGTPVKVATVINFPQGKDTLEKVLVDMKNAIQDGADEIDVVWPYYAFLNGDHAQVAHFVQACKAVCGTHVKLKVILETGRLPDVDAIYEAARLAIDAGADFIKTSTGKIDANATPEAAAAMLLAIRDSKKPVGFKAAGGIRTTEQAAEYLEIAEYIMGIEWISSDNIRFGASLLINDILESL